MNEFMYIIYSRGPIDPWPQKLFFPLIIENFSIFGESKFSYLIYGILPTKLLGKFRIYSQ